MKTEDIVLKYLQSDKCREEKYSSVQCRNKVYL